MATVEEVQAKLNALINNLSPQARRQLAPTLGKLYGKINKPASHVKKTQTAQHLNQENQEKNLAKRKAELSEKPCL